MTAITLRQLGKQFGPTVAVDDVNLDIHAGELFFLLGPSGCGKTTLLRLLAGFIEPTRGQIHFNQRDVTHLPTQQRHTAMVFQGYALWPHMSVAQNVAFGLDVRRLSTREKQTRVQRALDMVQLADLAQRKPGELSGGQQQRVALARALVIEPSVLLLDEPLSNLDARLREDMRSRIRDICKKAGLTAVYVTHDQKEALCMADRIAVMHRGSIIQLGPPRDVYPRPATRFVADFLGDSNFITGTFLQRDKDETILQTAAGPMRCTQAPPDLPSDAKLTCCLRPEAVRLLAHTDAPMPNTFTARCVRSIYLGETAQHHLQLTDNLTLKALQLHPEPLHADQPLRIAFDPHDLVVIAE